MNRVPRFSVIMPMLFQQGTQLTDNNAGLVYSLPLRIISKDGSNLSMAAEISSCMRNYFHAYALSKFDYTAKARSKSDFVNTIAVRMFQHAEDTQKPPILWVLEV